LRSFTSKSGEIVDCGTKISTV